jgi:cobalt-zinc-cadmium efflux system membrane fusion protein
MKIKYITIAVFVVVAISLGVFSWRNVNSEENQVQAERLIPTDEEEKKHDTRDHDEHGNDNSTNPDVHAEHDEPAEEEGEEGHGEEIVRLSDAELREFGVTLETAQTGTLNQYIELPGEIVLNADRIAHVVPRVAGIVREVRATVGDQVEKGQLLAVLESRELADAKAAYLAAIEREKLAQANFKREERLWKKKVTSEQEYLDARQALAEVRIAKNSAEQQLHALGCSEKDLLTLASSEHASFTHYTITAPFAGTVIEKHITFGEQVGEETDVFTIADLSTVWVNMDIYQKDLVSISKGQTVGIEIGHGIPSVEGKIAWVGPQVDEGTRTAKARIELPNPDGSLRPGLFVTAKVAVGSSQAALAVPKSALQTFEGKTVVFVRTDDGFEPKPVETGRENGIMVEILSGLAPGQTYVSQGVFTLKAQLSKGAFGDGHNH